MTSAIVLAAGLSLRMGVENKLLMPYKNKPVIVHIVECIMAAGFQEVIVVTGHEAKLVESVLTGTGAITTYNERYREGMTSSIQQGVTMSNGDGYMICLSDMVTITPEEYKLLAIAFEEKLLSDSRCIILPQHNNEKGNPVIFSAAYREAILQNKEPEGCRNIVQANRSHLYMVEMSTPHILQDFDNPDDYNNLVPTL